ncbi:MAG: GNAT family N-acetyltransferase [bacterium]|nr:GNAT family N-acetyltransferase [bacterium]
MNLKIKIRKAELRDTQTIADYNCFMAKETEKKELDPDTVTRGVKAVIKDPHKGFYLVAETKGEIAGQLLVTTEWSDWRNKSFWWIASVYVPEDYRKQGIFSSLYRHLEEMARYEKSVAGLRLYVEQYNETAQQTYQQLGMHNSGYKLYEIIF